MEPNFSGNYFTWRGGLNFSIHSKIDRVFVNNLWMETYSQFGVNFGCRSINNHSPINIKFIAQNKKKFIGSNLKMIFGMQ